MSDFLYCHDPLDENVGEYLLHLGNPTALIKIIPLGEEDAIESNEFIHKTFMYEDDEIAEEYQLIFTPLTKATEATATYPAELVNDILDTAWDYWVDVLDMEEDEEEED
jgi:hypothetical protein